MTSPTMSHPPITSRSVASKVERPVERLASIWGLHYKSAEKRMLALPQHLADTLFAMRDNAERQEQFIGLCLEALAGAKVSLPTEQLEEAEITADAEEDISQGLLKLHPTPARLVIHDRALLKQGAASFALARRHRQEGVA